MNNENKDEDFKNKYEILNKIAKGGFGEVYKAKIKNTDELRAIKFINKESIKDNLKNEYNSNDIEIAFNEFQNKLLNIWKYVVKIIQIKIQLNIMNIIILKKIL